MNASDWSGLHRRIEAIRTALEQDSTPSREDEAARLRARAQALSREPEPEQAAQEYLEVVEFRLAQERYAIESPLIREVYPLKELTPLPCTPAFVRGVINVRGQIVSIIDLKTFFDLPDQALTDLNKVLIVQNDRMEFGILADVIIGGRCIPHAAIQPPLATLSGIRAEYMYGVTSERLVILDARKILADPRIVVHEEVAI
jgi:purine-binding chemotaxis protein CheW